jgi:hypothetical protein
MKINLHKEFILFKWSQYTVNKWDNLFHLLCLSWTVSPRSAKIQYWFKILAIYSKRWYNFRKFFVFGLMCSMHNLLTINTIHVILITSLIAYFATEILLLLPRSQFHWLIIPFYSFNGMFQTAIQHDLGAGQPALVNAVAFIYLLQNYVTLWLWFYCIFELIFRHFMLNKICNNICCLTEKNLF